MATEIRDVEALRAEVDALRSVCAQAYQLAGSAGAPEQALDVLLAAAEGLPLPHGGEFLPIAPDEFDEVRTLRDALVGIVAAAHADGQSRLTPEALHAVATTIEPFDGPLASYLRAEAQDFGRAFILFSDVQAIIDAWMQSRRANG